MRVTNLGAVSGFEGCRGEGHGGVLQDLQLTTEQSQMAICDPDTQRVILEGMASLVDGIKATIKCIYPEKDDCPPAPGNAWWNLR